MFSVSFPFDNYYPNIANPSKHHTYKICYIAIRNRLIWELCAQWSMMDELNGRQQTTQPKTYNIRRHTYRVHFHSKLARFEPWFRNVYLLIIQPSALLFVGSHPLPSPSTPTSYSFLVLNILLVSPTLKKKQCRDTVESGYVQHIILSVVVALYAHGTMIKCGH